MSTSVAAKPVTAIVYFRELSDNNSTVAVPASFLLSGAGFSFFAESAIDHCFTTVGATSSFLQENNTMEAINVNPNAIE